LWEAWLTPREADMALSWKNQAGFKEEAFVPV
jgi:hypothetical protein